MKVVVIGGGISGLAAAYRLTRRDQSLSEPVEVELLEASDRLGGVISTRRFADYIVEDGPDAFITTKPQAVDLCEELGLQGELLATNCEHRRAFVAWNGSLYPLPAGFSFMAPTRLWPFLDSSLFTLRGKIRTALEIFQPRRESDGDESLSDFIVRRFGNELFERVAQPLIAGIYTADPAKLSACAAIPQFTEMERKHGSIILGLIAQTKMDLFSIIGGATGDYSGTDGGARYSTFVTLKGGMGRLVERLAEAIGHERIRLNSPVEKLLQLADARRKTGSHRADMLPSEDAGKAWSVRLVDGQSIECDAVVCATSARVAGNLICDIDGSASAEFKKFQTASSVVITFLFNRTDVEHPLNGFGLVIPACQVRSIFALSFASVKFEGRAPHGQVALRAFMGGALQPDLCELPDSDLIKLALDDIRYYLGTRAYPRDTFIKRWPDSMPQYQLGHLERVARIDQWLKKQRGLAWVGNALSGVGIPDCIATANRAAHSLTT